MGRYTAQPNGSQLQEIAELIDRGRVKVVVAGTLELHAAAEVQAALKENHIRDKVVRKVAD